MRLHPDQDCQTGPSPAGFTNRYDEYSHAICLQCKQECLFPTTVSRVIGNQIQMISREAAPLKICRKLSVQTQVTVIYLSKPKIKKRSKYYAREKLLYGESHAIP